MIAQVAVSCAVYAIDQPYSYRVPENMALLPGMRVVVPFGRANRRTEAIVLAITTGSEENLKAISQVLDETPVMDDEQLRLAAFVRERYFCTYYDAVKAILPAGLWFRQEKVYRIRASASDCVSLLQGRQTETALLAFLEDLGGSAPEGALLSQMEDRAAAEAAVPPADGWEAVPSAAVAADPAVPLEAGFPAALPGRLWAAGAPFTGAAGARAVLHPAPGLLPAAAGRPADRAGGL